MKTEYFPVLTAEEGMMLYNGETYSDKVYVGRLDSIDNWQEVPMEQYLQWRQQQDEAMDDEQSNPNNNP